MNNFHNIMVVIEPKQLRQPALERGIALYQYAVAHAKHHGSDESRIKIIAVLPVVQENWNIASFLAVDKKAFEDDYVEKQKRWLNAYLAINAMGLNIDARVLYSREISKDLVALEKEVCADIVIKTADMHGLLDSIVFTTLDWQMLRHSPVPVCIAKDHLWNPSGIIAVAVNLSDPEDEILRLTNQRLIREAQKLSLFTGCRLALIIAITPLVPPVAVDLPGFTPKGMYDSAVKDSCKRALDFAKSHKISPDDCHIAEGSLEEVIIDECRKLNPTALFIGTSARRGLASALVRNICEKVTDTIDCDVMVITPKTVMRNVPTSNPSKAK